MNFKVGDKVVVIAGKDKGKEGKIIKTIAIVLTCENSQHLFVYSPIE